MKFAPAQLSVRNVRKSFHGKAGEVRVLDDLSFDINARDFVGIIGPSGCGKTTIFNIIAGLIEPDAGTLIYAFSTVTARNGVDPDTAQRVVNGMEKAMRFMVRNEATTVEIAKKKFPTLDPVVVEAAVKRMLADGVYPPSVDITPEALKVSMDTQIALGNLSAQPEYKSFVVRKYIELAWR